jgi:Na+/phosphate symporter
MNYSIIQTAREELIKYEKECKELKERISLSLFSLPRSNLNSTEKKKL